MLDAKMCPSCEGSGFFGYDANGSMVGCTRCNEMGSLLLCNLCKSVTPVYYRIPSPDGDIDTCNECFKQLTKRLGSR